MELLIHAGPHRTGSTTIQNLLDDNRNRLIDFGIFYPKGLRRVGEESYDPSHSHIPYHYLGYDIRYLGLDERSTKWPEEFADWINQAQNLHCKKILISSEEFSSLSHAQWMTFLAEISTAARSSGERFERINVFYVNRELDQLSASFYTELLNNGMPLSAEDAKPLIKNLFQENREQIKNLASSRNPEVNPHFLDDIFPADASTRADSRNETNLSRWFELTLGAEVKAELHLNPMQLNKRPSSKAVEQLQAFNKVNTPSSLQFPSYFTTLDLSEEDLQARTRLRMFREILDRNAELCINLDNMRHDHDALRRKMTDFVNDLEVTQTQVSNLEQSRSWRWTKWLRFLNSKCPRRKSRACE
jgi:hypothetical protein